MGWGRRAHLTRVFTLTRNVGSDEGVHLLLPGHGIAHHAQRGLESLRAPGAIARERGGGARSARGGAARTTSTASECATA